MSDATLSPASASVQGGVTTADSDRMIQIFREMNRIQCEQLAETRRHSELVKAHGRRFQELEASNQMLMGVAFAVTGERVAAERHMAHALLSDPHVSTDFASYWPESHSALEAARTWISSGQPQADRQPQTLSLEEMSRQLLELKRKVAALGRKADA